MNIILIIVFLFALQVLHAQPQNNEKRQAYLKYCADKTDPIIVDAVYSESFCSCMVDKIMEQAPHLSTDKPEQIESFLNSHTGQGILSQCVTDNIKPGFWDDFKPKFQKECVNNLGNKQEAQHVNVEPYCECMYEKIRSGYQFAELLPLLKYQSPNNDKLINDAINCAMKHKK